MICLSIYPLHSVYCIVYMICLSIYPLHSVYCIVYMICLSIYPLHSVYCIVYMICLPIYPLHSAYCIVYMICLSTCPLHCPHTMSTTLYSYHDIIYNINKNSLIGLYADDTKLSRKIATSSDCAIFQRDLKQLVHK